MDKTKLAGMLAAALAGSVGGTSKESPRKSNPLTQLRDALGKIATPDRPKKKLSEANKAHRARQEWARAMRKRHNYIHLSKTFAVEPNAVGQGITWHPCPPRAQRRRMGLPAQTGAGVADGGYNAQKRARRAARPGVQS